MNNFCDIADFPDFHVGPHCAMLSNASRRAWTAAAASEIAAHAKIRDFHSVG